MGKVDDDDSTQGLYAPASKLDPAPIVSGLFTYPCVYILYKHDGENGKREGEERELLPFHCWDLCRIVAREIRVLPRLRSCVCLKHKSGLWFHVDRGLLYMFVIVL